MLRDLDLVLFFVAGCACILCGFQTIHVSKASIEAVSIARKLEVCKHSLTVELIEIDETLLFIGFGILNGKQFCEVLAKFIAHKLKYSPELCKWLVVLCLLQLK
jgi:hypothetical protein